MKKLRGKRAFTLVEVIVSIAIFAAIALPLFSVFVQSIKTDGKANAVMNANYIAQDYIEKLSAATYKQALENKPSNKAAGNYKLSAIIAPYGTAKSFFNAKCGYAHLIMNEDGTMLAVMPDGKWYQYASLPSSVSLSISGKNYTFTGGSKTITGTVGFDYCAMMINATRKPTGATETITLGTNCKAAYYCKELSKSDIMISGSCETYTNNIIGDTSLVYVKASVYDASGAEAAFSESYIHIKNW